MSRVVVLGGGESGVGSAVLAKVKGFDVFLSDNGKIEDRYADELRKWDIPFEQGGHTEDLILNADEVIKSPGIPDTVPMVRKVTDKGIRIISEIEFAGRYDSAKKICITGSNGKTTTTSLIYYLLRNAGLNVGLGGNIGKSYALQVATEHFDYYVLEISSFQLDNCYDFHPDIAIIMNITPDHLDRYGFQFENYIRSKFRITRNLSKEDCFIFDSDDEITIAHLSKIVLTAKMLPFTQKKEVGQGAFLKEDRIMVRDSWPSFRDRLRAQVYSFDKMKARLKAASAPCDPSDIGLSRQDLRNMFPKVQLMRFRFNLLDLAKRGGFYDTLVDSVFAPGGPLEI